MLGSGVRRAVAVCGCFVLALFAAACSSGSGRVATSSVTATTAGRTPSTTSGARSSTHRSKRAANTRAAKKGPAKPAGAHPSSTTRGNTVGSLGGPSLTVPSGTTPPATSGPSAVTTPPPTSATTPTTLPRPQPYDPSKPINLCCEPGVTPAEQARAEQLVRDTLRDLPRYADPAAAYADGYRSINDQVTGTEHYVKWAYVNDGHILDSRYPESLVYQMRSGRKTLVSAMYMMPLGTRFTDAPDVGGALTQWHEHNNLCLVDNPSDPLQKVVGGLTGSDGSCPAGSTKAAITPMLHVWIVKNPCGPFAPLEGIEGGQVPPGQSPLCDRAHGSV